MVQQAPITGFFDSCSPSLGFTYTGRQPMASLWRTLLVLEVMSLLTPYFKRCSTAHNLRTPQREKFSFMSKRALSNSHQLERKKLLVMLGLFSSFLCFVYGGFIIPCPFCEAMFNLGAYPSGHDQYIQEKKQFGCHRKTLGIRHRT